MQIKFKRATDARNWLTDNGYRFENMGRVSGTSEIYSTKALTAVLARVPWDGYRVTVKPNP